MHVFVKTTGSIALAALIAVRLTAAGPDQPTGDSVAIAQRVIRAAYPELKGNVTIAMDSDTDSDWRVASVVGVTLRVFDPSLTTHARVALLAHLQISSGQLTSVLFSGSYVEQDLRAIVGYARKQNDTRERVIEELNKAGIRFLSDEKAFIEAARVHRLEPILGKIESATARFVAVPPIPTPVDYEHQPVWVVELQTRRDENPSDCYGLLVEPVNLRVVRISRETCSK
jgi:hypothetical protein